MTLDRVREVDSDDPRRSRRGRRRDHDQLGLRPRGPRRLNPRHGSERPPLDRAAERRRLERRRPAARNLRLDVPRDHRAERRHLPCLRSEVQGAFRGEHRHRRPQPREHRRRAEQHLRRQREPDQEQDGGGVKGFQPGRHARDGGNGRDRPPLPDQAARLHAQRSPRGSRLRDRDQADRLAAHEGDLRPPPRRVLDRRRHRRSRRRNRGRAGRHSRDRPLAARPRKTALQPARRGHHPRPARARSSLFRPNPVQSPSQASSSTASVSVSSTPTRHASPRRDSPSSKAPSRPGGSSCSPTR